MAYRLDRIEIDDASVAQREFKCGLMAQRLILIIGGLVVRWHQTEMMRPDTARLQKLFVHRRRTMML